MMHLRYMFLSAAVMLGLPWLAVTFAPGDAGMAICFLLFFAIDPVYAVWMGVQAGKRLRRLWYQPFVTAAAFLAGTWLMFDMGEPAFVLYASVYLLLGYLSMLIVLLFKRRS